MTSNYNLQETIVSAMEKLIEAVIELAEEDCNHRVLQATPERLIHTITGWIEEYVDVPPTKREMKFFEAHEYALDKLCRKHQVPFPKIA